MKSLVSPAVTISVEERSTVNIGRAQFQGLQGSDSFLDLLEAGIFSLVRSKAHRYGLRSGPFVGESLIDGQIRLRIVEKSEGAIGALLHWALPEDVRVVSTPAAGGESGRRLELFVQHFLANVSAYVGIGRVREYVPEFATSSTPRGRLNLAATMRLRAHGVRDRLSFSHWSLSADILPNRLLALGLCAVETFERVTTRLLERSRALSMLFEDAAALTTRRIDTREMRQLFDALSVDAGTGSQLRAALAYARILALHVGAWPHRQQEPLPESYFLNLETLFEDAVRQVWSEASAGYRVVSGASLRQELLVDSREGYKAEPDIVALSRGGRTLIADCKYKDVDRPGNDDIYQLVAHAGAFLCRDPVLIYPGQAFGCRMIGRTSDGISVWNATVRLSSLGEDVGAVFRTLRQSAE
ncbi:MAG: McrC family protein [Chloroflexota bacterium]|nr:McrC family protein [Chloroflexota bacterium]